MSIFFKIKNWVYKLVLPGLLFVLSWPLIGKAAFGSGGVRGGLVDVSQPFSGVSPSNINNAGDLITFIIEILLYIAGGIAVVFVIIGGYQYLTSGGNEEQAEKGRKTVTNAIIGVVIVVLSWVVINVITNTIRGF